MAEIEKLFYENISQTNMESKIVKVIKNIANLLDKEYHMENGIIGWIFILFCIVVFILGLYYFIKDRK